MFWNLRAHVHSGSWNRGAACEENDEMAPMICAEALSKSFQHLFKNRAAFDTLHTRELRPPRR